MDGRTIPRPKSLDDLEPTEAAAAVDQFIGTPQRSGPWVIEPFKVDRMGALMSAIRGNESGGGRCVPEGEYIYLRNTEFDPNHQPLKDETEAYTMMSNTPDEINDHELAFDHAEGRVLVNGLGLSCVVSGLLANPAVEHIDVVEYSEDVIAMVGPAYEDEPRVTIHLGDALTFPWPDDARWDFAWHDIWAKISDDNLVSVTAENGISYEALFRRFADKAEFQEAWAFPMALAMRQSDVLADLARDKWRRDWAASTPERRLEMLLDYHAEGQFAPSREALLEFWGQSDTLEKIKEACEDDTERVPLIDPRKFLIQAQLYVPQLIEEEYERYGLVPNEAGQATKNMTTGVER